jgi:uncharacterized protein YndB with AHSA1/START domain
LAGENPKIDKFVYREIVEPEKLVFTDSFSDEASDTVRAPFSQTWPLEILNTWTFAEHEDKTTLTMRGVPLSATAEELKTFEAAHDMVQKGFDGTCPTRRLSGKDLTT